MSRHAFIIHDWLAKASLRIQHHLMIGSERPPPEQHVIFRKLQFFEEWLYDLTEDFLVACDINQTCFTGCLVKLDEDSMAVGSESVGAEWMRVLEHFLSTLACATYDSPTHAFLYEGVNELYFDQVQKTESQTGINRIKVSMPDGGRSVSFLTGLVAVSF